MLNVLIDLKNKINQVDQHVTISEEATQEIADTADTALVLGEKTRRQASRNRKVNAVLVILLLLSGYGFFQNQEAIHQIKQAAKTQCESGNKRSDQIKKPWKVLITGSLQQPGNQNSPEALKFLQDFNVWIDTIYAPRDCNNPNQEVNYPDPPKFPVIKQEK